jgi:probable poly-beta-1,6-N-acetyl-D-glucosamine export protein
MNSPSAEHVRTPFRGDIHRLRGIAILLIVATHCVTFFQWTQHPLGLAMVMDLFDNSTLIFMFISGYLFHHTSAQYQYTKYLRTKLFNVLLPYAIAATPGLIYMLVHEPPPDVATPNNLSFIARTLDMLLYGGSQVNYALWFIPVICIYYLASPLLMLLTRRPALYAVLLVLLPLSVLMHRPSYAHGHNILLALYFLSAYLSGMFCSQFHDRIVPMLDRNLGLLCVFTFTLVTCHLLFSSHHGKYTAISMLSLDRPDGLIDWLFVQKLLITLTLWGLIRRFASRRLAFLDHIANVSFTIYFLHIYAMYCVLWLTQRKSVEISLPAFACLLAIGVAVPSLIAWGTRKVAPQWSRSLVGS